ncbi:MAG: 50S ribosomal protein L21 [Acidimicrobiales bacterium]
MIDSGGKQATVRQGETLAVERLDASPGDQVSLRPVLVVDGVNVISAPQELVKVSVTARVVGEAKGPKIKGFTYKPKTRGRKAWGHRQHYSTVEITAIDLGGHAAVSVSED